MTKIRLKTLSETDNECYFQWRIFSITIISAIPLMNLMLPFLEIKIIEKFYVPSAIIKHKAILFLSI